MMLLQFGREVFFTLTGFVLVYSALRKPTTSGRFWAKRILYVAVPYTAWSAIYYAYSVLGPQGLKPSLSTFADDLLYGGAMYHLYFLLVTLQLYMVFPLLMRMVRATAGRAGLVLGLVAAANLVWLGLIQWVPAPAGAPGWFWGHAYEFLPTYSMYVLAGCYAAVHLGRLQQIVDRHAGKLAAVAAVSAAGAIAAYAAQLPDMAPRSAGSVLQPATTLACVAALITVYMVGCHWAAGPRRHQSTIAALSDLSFGVYLAHPLVLQLMLDHGLANQGQVVPPAVASFVGYSGAVAGGIAVTWLARRTPLSLALTGRPWAPGQVRAIAPARVNPRAAPTPVFTPVQIRQGGRTI